MGAGGGGENMNKDEMLSKFSKKDLQDICKSFEISYVGLNKDILVQELQSGKIITKNFIELLLERPEKTIREKLSGIKKDFFADFVQSRINLIEEVTDYESNIIAYGLLKDTTNITRLHEYKSNLEDMGGIEEKLPKEIDKTISSKQRNAYRTWKKKAYYKHLFFKKSLDKLKDNDIIAEIFKIEDIESDDKIKYYLLQARVCYSMKCYDACIVMLARTLEYSLKQYLIGKDVETPKKAVLHELINAYRKTNPPNVELLEKVIEVQRFDRNITAHDKDIERYQFGKKEADHSWTATRIILKELLNIEYKPLIEKA